MPRAQTNFLARNETPRRDEFIISSSPESLAHKIFSCVKKDLLEAVLNVMEELGSPHQEVQFEAA